MKPTPYKIHLSNLCILGLFSLPLMVLAQSGGTPTTANPNYSSAASGANTRVAATAGATQTHYINQSNSSVSAANSGLEGNLRAAGLNPSEYMNTPPADYSAAAAADPTNSAGLMSGFNQAESALDAVKSAPRMKYSADKITNLWKRILKLDEKRALLGASYAPQKIALQKQIVTILMEMDKEGDYAYKDALLADMEKLRGSVRPEPTATDPNATVVVPPALITDANLSSRVVNVLSNVNITWVKPVASSYRGAGTPEREDFSR